MCVPGIGSSIASKPDMILWGEYHDQWVRIDGTWRILERRVKEAGIEPRRDGGVLNPRRAKAGEAGVL